MANKLTDDQLRDLVANCPPSGSMWRHYKNRHVYAVVGAAILEATHQPYVIYARPVPSQAGIQFSRPLAEWEELVDDDQGVRRERFQRVINDGVGDG